VHAPVTEAVIQESQVWLCFCVYFMLQYLSFIVAYLLVMSS